MKPGDKIGSHNSIGQNSPDFLAAVDRARNRMGLDIWNTATLKAKRDAIYIELKALDQERLRSPDAPDS